MNNNIYVGAMSGTSHDSVDVSFIEVINSIKLKAFHSKKISSSMQLKIQEAMSLGKISLDKYGSLDKEIGDLTTKFGDSFWTIHQNRRHELGGVSEANTRVVRPGVITVHSIKRSGPR